MAGEFNPNANHAIFRNVTCLERFTSKKGGQCAKIGWMNETGAGEKVFFGDEICGMLTVGMVYDIRANLDGDFFRNWDVREAGAAETSRTRKPA